MRDQDPGDRLRGVLPHLRGRAGPTGQAPVAGGLGRGDRDGAGLRGVLRSPHSAGPGLWVDRGDRNVDDRAAREFPGRAGILEMRRLMRKSFVVAALALLSAALPLAAQQAPATSVTLYQ